MYKKYESSLEILCGVSCMYLVPTLFEFQKFYIQDWLKVRKSQKQIMVASILPGNKSWDNFHYIKLSQRSFFGILMTP